MYVYTHILYKYSVLYHILLSEYVYVQYILHIYVRSPFRLRVDAIMRIIQFCLLFVSHFCPLVFSPDYYNIDIIVLTEYKCFQTILLLILLIVCQFFQDYSIIDRINSVPTLQNYYNTDINTGSTNSFTDVSRLF